VAAWTRFIVAHRKSVLVGWLLLALLGAYATSNLGKLLTNRFSVPGSDAEKGLNILRTRFHERGDGAFTLVVQSTGPTLRPVVAEAAAQRAAAEVRDGRAGPPRSAGRPGPTRPASDRRRLGPSRRRHDARDRSRRAAPRGRAPR
jgi:hypothetical protein